MKPGRQDEFFIGWQGRAPAETGRRVRNLTFALGLVALVAAGACAALQRTIGSATWEYGNLRDFEGVFLASPAPLLIADEPEPASGASVFLLVNPFKHGFDAQAAEGLHLRRATLRGSLLHRAGGAMLEVEPGSVNAAPELCGAPPIADLGPVVLAGEIVDAKCYLGAMNPGVLKPHRACAIRCLSGGIPAAFVVRHAAGEDVRYLLVAADGGPPDDRILDFVAEPVEIGGRVSRMGGILVFRADLTSLQRLP